MSTSSDGRLTATVDTGTASIRLSVDFSAVTGVGGKPCRVTVTRGDGTVVRGLSSTAAPSGLAYGIDHEAPLAQGVSYTASVTDWRGTTVLATSTAATATLANVSDAQAWLKSLRTPSLSMLVTLQALPDWQSDIAQGVFYALGRADPVVVSDVRQFGTGTLGLYAMSASEQASLAALLRAPGPYLLQCGPDVDVDRYVAVGRVQRSRLAPVPNPYYGLSLPLTEVARPSAANSRVAIPGHAYADSARRWPTYADRTGTYADRLTA